VSEEIIVLLKAEHKLIERSDIVLEDVIGEGQFGCVKKGILFYPELEQNTDVAVKTLQNC
jgi:hypothetical protein